MEKQEMISKLPLITIMGNKINQNALFCMWQNRAEDRDFQLFWAMCKKGKKGIAKFLSKTTLPALANFTV